MHCRNIPQNIDPITRLNHLSERNIFDKMMALILANYVNEIKSLVCLLVSKLNKMEATMDVIDQEKLFELYGSQDTATDIIHMFIDKSDTLINEIQEAIQSENPDILAKICHKGIGQSRYIAAPLIEETLRDLQQAQSGEKEKHFAILKQMINHITNDYS